MLRIAICDDEQPVRMQLRKLVERQIDADILEFGDGESLLESGEELDILLLDICIGDTVDGPNMNGMETARKFREKSRALIIFITALREYACQAFDVEAFHYLLKPVDEAKFKAVLAKAARLADYRKAREPLVVKVEGSYYSIPAEDIYYAESGGRKIILHTVRGNLSYYEKMDHLEKKLGSAFFRSHRGYLVHLGKVASYDSGGITMENGDRVYLSKQKYAKFIETYMEYLGSL